MAKNKWKRLWEKFIDIMTCVVEFISIEVGPNTSRIRKVWAVVFYILLWAGICAVAVYWAEHHPGGSPVAGSDDLTPLEE
jgi:hypothetical protein